MRLVVVGVCAGVLVLLGACSSRRSPSTAKQVGEEGGPCFSDSKCKEGLRCLSRLCAKVPVLDAGEGRRDTEGGRDANDIGSPPSDVLGPVNDVVPHVDKRASKPGVATLAGNGKAGYGDGLALAAQFSSPLDVAVDSAGRVYVVEKGTHLIRMISGGRVSTLAGDRVFATNGGYKNGATGKARFSQPSGVAVDSADIVYVADAGNHCIRQIIKGVVSAFTRCSTWGNVDGPVAKAVMTSPSSINAASGSRLLLTEPGSNRVRRIASGIVTTFLATSKTTMSQPVDATMDGKGVVYITDPVVHGVWAIVTSTYVTLANSRGGGFRDGPMKQALFKGPAGLATDAKGTVYIADSGNHRIRALKGSYNGNVSTVTGGVSGFADGSLARARFNSPRGVAVDSRGHIYVADTGNHRIRVVVP